MKAFAAFGLLLATMVALLSGCDGNGLLKTAPGVYEGSITTRGPNARPPLAVRASVRPKSKESGNDTLLLRAASEKTGQSWNFAVKVVDKSHAWFYSPTRDFAAYFLEKAPDGCFQSEPAKNETEVSLCFFSGRELSIRFVSRREGYAFGLALMKYDPARRLPMEVPAHYTVDQLMSRTFQLGFAAQEQFQKVVEARETTKMAYGNLFPHLSMASLAALVGLGLTGNLASSASNMLRSIGDLVPFLVPTRWFEASKAESRELAESYGLFLVKVDSAAITQGLAYSVLRENSLLASIEASITDIERERDLVKAREGAAHLEQVSASEDIQTILDRMSQARAQLEETRKTELIALAQAAGFVNERAIANVDPTPEHNRTIDRPMVIDEDAAPGLATSSSYELRQLDALIDAANQNREERRYNWLDPAGDPMGGLGFGTSAYIAVAKAQLEELEGKRRERESDIRKKAAAAIERMKQSLALHELAQAGIETQNRLIDRYHLEMKLGIDFSMTDFARALLERVMDEIAEISAEYAYAMALGDLDRWEYAGPYADMSPAWIR